MTKYAISAATGHFGQVAMTELLKSVPASDVVAIVRNPDKAQKVLPSGIEIRQADYTDSQALTQALQGIDRLLFVSSIPGQTVPRQQQHQNLIQAAQKAQVSYIAYTSFAKADSAQSDLAQDHIATEKMLKASGITYSFLRNAWYLENELAYLQAGKNGQPMTYAAGDGRISFALEREYAEAAAKVLLTPTPKKVYEFGGEPVSFGDLAAAEAKVVNHPVDFHNVSDEDFYQELLANGTNQGLATVLLGMQKMMRAGELEVPSTDLATVLGHQPTDIVTAIQEVLN